MKKSKFFRVATEGATTDGRKIERQWITEIAETYDPDKYGARVWLEHMRGLLPDSPFKSYGDVLDLEAREVENGKMALFAQISPTDDLIELNKNRQKIYTSIEVREKFADTGKAYLIGLGITDSPASLGTEALAFSSKTGLFNNRKTYKDSLFSEAVETEIEFEEERKSLSDMIKHLFATQRKEIATETSQDFSTAVEPLIQEIVRLEKNVSSFKVELEAVLQENKTLKEQFNALTQTLSQTEEHENVRPIATGASTSALTDC